MGTIDTDMKKAFTLIELLVVIGVLAILLTITLIAINPAHQFAQSNDTKRRSDILAILNAVHQSTAENKGILPAQIPDTTAGALEIKLDAVTPGADLCAVLAPVYVPAFPVDPAVSYDGGTAAQGDPIPSTACAVAYNTGYTIVRDAGGRVTVSADSEVTPGTFLTVTR